MNIFVRSIEFIVVHCSATPPNMDIGVKEIDEWHRARGWSKIGYHIIIRRAPGELEGLIEYGDRSLLEAGAHVLNYNYKSLGICMIGGVNEFNNPENNFTNKQFEALRKTIDFLTGIFPNAIVQGHRNFPGVNKDCPCFNVKDWMSKRDLRRRAERLPLKYLPGIL